MDDSGKKRMMEFLGVIPDRDCFDAVEHKWPFLCDTNKDIEDCSECIRYLPVYFTFDTPDDFFAVKNRLVDNDDWGEFTDYASDVYLAEIDRSSICDYCESFWCWLIDPARFCQLCADFLKGRENG